MKNVRLWLSLFVTLLICGFVFYAYVLRTSIAVCGNANLDAWALVMEKGAYPHSVERECNKKTVVETYALGAPGYAPMPGAWVFQGSDDETKWFDLDRQTGMTDWQLGDSGVFDLAKPASYRYYRLYATAGAEPDVTEMAVAKFEVVEEDEKPIDPSTDVSTSSCTKINDLHLGGIYPHPIKIKCLQPKLVKRYRLASGLPPVLMPGAWIFQGSNDKHDWVDLDKRTGVTGWQLGDYKTFHPKNGSKQSNPP